MAIALGCSQEFPFILLHNRDEEYSRPTGQPELLHDGIYCQKDLLAGGTWMGLNVHTGALAALVNVRGREMMPASRVSRGQIVSEILRGAEVSSRSECYKYSILRSDNIFPQRGQVPRVFWETCVPGRCEHDSTWERVSREVSSGSVYSRSNERTSDLMEGLWKKTDWLRCKVAQEIASAEPTCVGREGARSLAASLGRLLSTRCDFARAELGSFDFSPHSEEMELLLQRGPFVDASAVSVNPDGTRQQTVVICCASTREVYYFTRDSTGVPHTEVHDKKWEEFCVVAPV